MTFPVQQGLFKFIDLDHYAILGVPITADVKEIRQRYLTIARLLHPDTCKAPTREEKEKASQVLTKLINPSWESLSKEHSRSELRVVMAQIGRGLAPEAGKITLNSEGAKKLYQARTNLDLTYITTVKSLSAEQYHNLNEIYPRIAQLSELNLIYLTLAPNYNSGDPRSTIPNVVAKKETEQPIEMPVKEIIKEEKVKESPLANYIRRAQDFVNQENYTQAIRELKDALKIEPNNSTCHGLLGFAYLKQKQNGMARVYINNALKYNPQEPNALKAKQELDKLQPTAKPQNPEKPQKKGGFWTRDLFGGNKKSP